jgi:Protein of unknown function (DUF2909)
MMEQTHGSRSESGWTRHSPGVYKQTHMEMIVRILIVAVLIGIVASLGSALFQLSRKSGDSRRLARDLTIRVGLSVALFLLLMIAWYLGLIAPHGLSARP